jgi:hypothetical protein
MIKTVFFQSLKFVSFLPPPPSPARAVGTACLPVGRGICLTFLICNLLLSRIIFSFRLWAFSPPLLLYVSSLLLPLLAGE